MTVSPPTSVIVEWSRRFLADLLDLPVADIDARAKFTEIGLDSGKSVQFVLALEDWLGVELDPGDIEQHPTIGGLAAWLAGARARAAGRQATERRLDSARRSPVAG